MKKRIIIPTVGISAGIICIGTYISYFIKSYEYSEIYGKSADVIKYIILVCLTFVVLGIVCSVRIKKAKTLKRKQPDYAALRKDSIAKIIFYVILILIFCIITKEVILALLFSLRINFSGAVYYSGQYQIMREHFSFVFIVGTIVEITRCCDFSIKIKQLNENAFNDVSAGINTYEATSDIKYCSECGNKIEYDGFFCSQCGNKIIDNIDNDFYSTKEDNTLSAKKTFKISVIIVIVGVLSVILITIIFISSLIPKRVDFDLKYDSNEIQEFMDIVCDNAEVESADIVKVGNGYSNCIYADILVKPYDKV